MIGVDHVQREHESAHKDDATSSSSSSSTEDEHGQKSSCNDTEEDDAQKHLHNNDTKGGYTQKAKHYKTKRSYQHLPLYISFLFAITALTLSIITHKSTSFVSLTDPLNAGPFFKSINEVGLNYWKLCSIKQNGLDFILDEKILLSTPSGDEDEVLESGSSDIIKEGPRGPYIQVNQDDDLSHKETIMQDGSGQLLEVPPSISFIRSAHDTVRNVTFTVQTTYHNTNSIQQQQQQQRDWYSEPNHDDILLSCDYH